MDEGGDPRVRYISKYTKSFFPFFFFSTNTRQVVRCDAPSPALLKLKNPNEPGNQDCFRRYRTSMLVVNPMAYYVCCEPPTLTEARMRLLQSSAHQVLLLVVLPAFQRDWYQLLYVTWWAKNRGKRCNLTQRETAQLFILK